MTDHKRIDPLYKANIRKALDGFLRGSTEASEQLLYARTLMPQGTVDEILGLTNTFLEKSPPEPFPWLNENFLSAFVVNHPELANIGNSDPEMAEAYFAREFMKTLKTLLENTKATHKGEAVQLPIASPTHQNHPVDAQNTPTILDAWKEYTAEKGKGWRPSTTEAYLATITEFTSSEFTGNPAIGSLTRDDLITYRNMLQRLPKQRTKLRPYRDKSVSELLAMNIPTKDLMMGRTINERLGLISSFLTWCHEIKSYLSKDITYDILLKQVESATRSPFTDDEIKQLFDPERYKSARIDSPYKFWLPLLGLFTGARISEIAQLQTTDIIVQDGVPAIQIVHRTKTKAGRRIVPIHTVLLEAGLLDYVDHIKKHKAESLFPDMRVGSNKPGDAASKWFTRYRRAAGIADTDNLEREKVFHSFRHSFVTRLRQSDPAPDIKLIQQIVGHEKELFGATGIYTSDFPVSQCKTAIEKLHYPIDAQLMREIWPTLMKS